MSLSTHLHAPVPPPRHLVNKPHEEWIDTILEITTTTNMAAIAITIKYTKQCVQKTISKYCHLYEINLKKVNRKIFKITDIPPVDSLLDQNNNILTSTNDIANENTCPPVN